MSGRSSRGGSGSGGANPGGIPGSVTPRNFNASDFGKSLGAAANNAFNAGNQVYQAPLYAGLSGRTNTALNNIASTANASQGYMNGAMAGTQALIGNGGFANGMGRNLREVEGLGAAAGGPSLTEQTLLGTARGQYLNGANPYFEANLRRASDDTYADVMASLGSSGRTGSSVHMDELTGALGDLNNSARSQQYETERDRQLQAIGAIEGTRQQAFGNQMTAASTAFGMGQQGVANRMAGMAALPGIYEASQMPNQTALQVGQMRDTDAQARLMADYDLFQRRDPYTHIARYMTLMNGSQDTAGVREEAPWWQTALGTAATVAGALF